MFAAFLRDSDKVDKKKKLKILTGNARRKQRKDASGASKPCNRRERKNPELDPSSKLSGSIPAMTITLLRDSAGSALKLLHKLPTTNFVTTN